MSMQSTLRSVADSKHEGIQSIAPTVSVSDAVAKMKERNIGALVVLNEDGGLAGIFSERDLLTRVVSEGLDTETTRIAEVMTPEPYCVNASTTVEAAMRTVTEQRIRHLPLVTGDKVENLISSGDLTAWALKSQQAEIESLSQMLGNSVKKNKALIVLIIGFLVLLLIGVLSA